MVSVRCQIAVKEAEALLGSLMALGTDHCSVLQLDQLLQAVACQLGYQLHDRAAMSSGAKPEAPESAFGHGSTA